MPKGDNERSAAARRRRNTMKKVARVGKKAASKPRSTPKIVPSGVSNKYSDSARGRNTARGRKAAVVDATGRGQILRGTEVKREGNANVQGTYRTRTLPEPAARSPRKPTSGKPKPAIDLGNRREPPKYSVPRGLPKTR